MLAAVCLSQLAAAMLVSTVWIYLKYCTQPLNHPVAQSLAALNQTCCTHCTHSFTPSLLCSRCSAFTALITASAIRITQLSGYRYCVSVPLWGSESKWSSTNAVLTAGNALLQRCAHRW